MNSVRGSMRAAFGVCAAVFGVWAVLVPLARAQVDPELLRQHGHISADRVPLANADARLAENGAPQSFVADAVKLARGAADERARARELDTLRRAVPALRFEEHELFGTARWLGSTLAFLTPPSELAPRDVVRTFVAWHPALLEIAPALLDDASVTRDFATTHTGARHLTFQQRAEGLELVGCRLKANVTRHGELVNVSSTWLPLGARELALPAAGVTALDALCLAAANVRAPLASDPEAGAAEAGPVARTTWHGASELDAEPAPVTERVLFPRTRTELVPAWRVILAPRNGDLYEVLVSAVDGSVLARTSQTHYFGGTEDISVRVYTQESPAPALPGPQAPNGQQFPLVARDLVTISGAQVAAASPFGWIPDGQNETLGNNVDGHTDVDANHIPDTPRPAGSPYRVFDFAQSNALAPSNWRPAAVTQVFWLANRFHDHLFALGFDEAAGNFQHVNVSGQGVAGDRLSADCQDGSGFDNARFITLGNDGSVARMELFLWDGTNPDRDSDLDALIVHHELTHGVSVRLHDGTLGGLQSAGMGEGWSDFFALCLSAELGDDPASTYPIAGYTSQLYWSGFQDNYYFGIRRYPYSTDLAKNPLTYADVDPGQIAFPPGVPRNSNVTTGATSPHAIGEVWCSALWEVRANLLATHGFAANELVQQLVVDGMKLSVDNPNFLDARDAILQGDLVASGGSNLGDLWRGFAKRGLGASATSPVGGTNAAGVHEAFDLPQLIVVTYPNGRPADAAPGVRTSFELDVTALGGQAVLPGTGLVHVSVGGAPFASAPLVEFAPGRYLVDLPGAPCLTNVLWYATFDSTFGPVTDPAAGAGDAHRLHVVTDASVAQLDDMQTANGWTSGASGDAAIFGAWTRVDPVGSFVSSLEVQPELDHTRGAGTHCWVTGQGTVGGSAVSSDLDGGPTTLLSPVYDVSALALPRIGYWRWFSNALGAAPAEDVLRVDVSDDGGVNWTTVEVVGPTTDNAGGWSYHEFYVDDFVTPTSTVRLRFVANDAGAGSLVEAAIDDVSVLASGCAPSSGSFCAGDGSLASACPCGNSGSAGRGCANSQNALGGRLEGIGTTQPDALVLHASGVPLTAPVLFFQGDQAHAGGVVYNDGVSCVTGAIVRLGTRTAAGGSADLPSPGDPALSVTGGVTPGSGALRFYQAIYRNAAATFCPPATANITNGWSVVW